MSQPVLDIRDLTLGFKGWTGYVEVLHGISLTINRGERVALVGESGSGKSVTARIILGLLQSLLPAAVAELGTCEQSVPRRLGRAGFELGVIAGTVNQLPFIPGQPEERGDGTVAVSETILPGMTDFIELPVGHTFMMWNDEVLEQVVFFLEHGLFRRSSPPFSAP